MDFGGLGSILAALMGSTSGMGSLGGASMSLPQATPPATLGVGLNSANMSQFAPGDISQKPSPFSMFGQALQNGPKDNTPVQPAQAYAPPQRPIDDSMLQQLLGSIGQRLAQGRYM